MEQSAFHIIPAPPVVLCAVAGCGKPQEHRQWCGRHYQRWLKHGDPERTVRKKEWDGRCVRCGSQGPFYEGTRTCKACRKTATYEGRRAEPERSRKQSALSSAKRHRERRLEVLAAYGGRCACCGESEPAFLAVDHINGGGNRHRRSLTGSGQIAGSSNFYRWLVKNAFPSDFQLLCHNCNFAKSHGGCPHQRVKEPQ